MNTLPNILMPKKFKKLTVKIKWSAGRNSKGRVICRSKGSHKFSRRYLIINYSPRDLFLGMVISFFLTPLKNKFLTLVVTSQGGWTYVQTSEITTIFSLFYIRPRCIAKAKAPNPLISILNQVGRSRKLCLMELIPGSTIQYARSPGTYAKLIKHDSHRQISLLFLPSGVKKIFSFLSICSKGRVTLKYHYRYRNTKSGFWRGFGFKPKTRGVAMNPIDHPNGGSTSSLRYPRTPWGKTTKFK